MKDRIKQIRLKLGMNQGEFAKALNIVQQQLSKYERGENKPSADFLTLLVEKFNVNINWLLTEKGEIFSSDADSNNNLSSASVSDNPFQTVLIPLCEGTEQFFDNHDNLLPRSIFVDTRLINRVPVENLRIIYMPDSSLSFAKGKFYAEKNDVLLVDVSDNSFDFGIYACLVAEKLQVFAVQKLIDGSVLFKSFDENRSEISYSADKLYHSGIKILGRVLKNMSLPKI